MTEKSEPSATLCRVTAAETNCETSTFCEASKDAAECDRLKFADAPLWNAGGYSGRDKAGKRHFQ